MKRKRNLLLIILIVSSLCLILFPKSVIGSIDDIDYTFENDILYSNDDLQFTNNWNTRNKTILTETYYATYSFTNETTGTNSTNILFIDRFTGAPLSTAIILDNYEGHDKVLDFYDNNGADVFDAYHDLNDTATSGTIELWYRTSNSNDLHSIYIMDGASANAFNLYTDGGLFRYYDGAFKNVGVNCISNTWYHIRIDFECGALGYLGLGADEMYITINDIQYGAFDARGNPTEIDIFRFFSEGADLNYHLYIDAIGFEWSNDANYTIGNNFIPIIEIDTSIKENDVFPFAYEDFDTSENPYEVDDNKFDSWEVVEENYNELSHQPVKQWSHGKTVYFEPHASSGQFGLQKDFDIAICNTINITWSILIEATDLFSSHLATYIYSEDTTELMFFTLAKDADSIYFADTDGTLVLDNLAINTVYSFNLYINLNDDILLINCYENSTIDNSAPTLIETFIRDTENHNQAGLGLVRFDTGLAPDDSTSMYLDYIGVYVDQISLSDQYGLLKINTADFIGANTFNLHNHNLLTFNIIGNASIRLPETFGGGGYIPGIFLCERLTDLKVYTGIEQHCIYFKRNNDYLETDPIIFLEIYDYVEFTSLTIEGSKLVQESNEYWLELEQGNVDLSESFFYVDSNNKLQFTLITDDSNTEYIQATFDIPNLSTTDRAISFRGYRLNKAYGYFVVDYITGLTTVEIPIIEKTTRSILPTNKTIDNFIILITDNDDDVILGTTTGFVSQPTLLSISGIGLPIITAGLIEMMIPLLLIMIPTLLISQGFGKEGKKLLIPLFLVFSLIATITEIIPVWIFFIIAFGNSLFLFRNKEIEG